MILLLSRSKIRIYSVRMVGACGNTASAARFTRLKIQSPG